MRLTVQYRHADDLNNFVRQLRNKYPVGYGTNVRDLALLDFPESFVDSVINASTDIEAEKCVLDYWHDTRGSDFLSFVTNKVTDLQSIINDNQLDIVQRLEDTYCQKFPFNEVYAFLTTFNRCPYSYPYWFMIYINAQPQKVLKTCTHELNHFMYYYYFEKKLRDKGLTYEQSEHLKESLAILTSSDGIENKNKPHVVEIQDFVQKHYQHNIDKIIDDTVKKYFIK